MEVKVLQGKGIASFFRFKNIKNVFWNSFENSVNFFINGLVWKVKDTAIVLQTQRRRRTFVAVFCRKKTIVNSKLTLLQNFLLWTDNTDNTCNKFATQHVYYHLSTPFSCLSFLHFFQFSFAVLRSLHLSRLNLFNYSFLEIKVKWGDIKLNKSNRIGGNWVQ